MYRFYRHKSFWDAKTRVLLYLYDHVWSDKRFGFPRVYALCEERSIYDYTYAHTSERWRTRSFFESLGYQRNRERERGGGGEPSWRSRSIKPRASTAWSLSAAIFLREKAESERFTILKHFYTSYIYISMWCVCLYTDIYISTFCPSVCWKLFRTQLRIIIDSRLEPWIIHTSSIYKHAQLHTRIKDVSSFFFPYFLMRHLSPRPSTMHIGTGTPAASRPSHRDNVTVESMKNPRRYFMLYWPRVPCLTHPSIEIHTFPRYSHYPW